MAETNQLEKEENRTKPGLPVLPEQSQLTNLRERIEFLENLSRSPQFLLKQLQNHIFILHYRAHFKPDDTFIVAENLDDAKRRGYDYCSRWKMRFIAVRPFFLDLDKSPKENQESGVDLKLGNKITHGPQPSKQDSN